MVKGTNFVGIRDAGDPVELAAYYAREGADELVFLDITATHEGRPSVIELAKRVAENVFIPFTVGGGLRTVDDIRGALFAGADKVSLNSSAVADPDLVTRSAAIFGAQCVVAAIDAKKMDAGWHVFTHGGRRDTGLDAIAWARELVERGAGEILLTSMDGDGTRQGYDLELTRAVSEAVDVPVIASGGAGHAGHLAEATLLGKADAVLLAGILHDSVARIGDLKHEMRRSGIPVRLD